MKYKKIALIGMMGSGKTTISKLLAKKTGWELFDTDKIFEQENNITISDFFKNYSQEEFRKKENELLKTISKNENIVISTGGGIILNQENREILFNRDIFSIYLKTNPNVIFERIKNDKSRPLLQVENPKAEIEKIISSREKYYNLAKLTVITNNKSTEEITEEIWKKLI